MSESPSVAELLGRLARLEAVVAEQAARIAVLEAENAELRRRLGRNSTNSSRPPASDSPFGKPVPKSLRGKSGRKPGGQPGRPGSTMAQVADPDELLRHEVTFRYANGTTTNRPMDITVNGALVADELAFNSTGNWDTWANATVTVDLTAGANTIRATATTVNGGPNADCLDLRPTST